jgi:vitamin B12 transporter
MKRKFFAVAAVFISSYAHSQDSSKVKQLDEVVVTANKFPQKQSTTGKVISVISKDQIEKSSGRTIGQLLNEQAGLTVNGSLNNIGSNQSVYMRGAGTGRTLVLLDGIPVYDPTLINNEFDINLVSLNDVERIEICRGAQSTLYGSDAVAGVINIITVKKDISKPFNVKATLSAGSFGMLRGNVQVYGNADKLTYTARYAKLKSDGFSSAYDSTGKNNFDNDSYDGDVANASLNYQAAPSISFRTFIQQSRYKSDVDNSIFTDEKDFFIKNKNTVAGAGFRYLKNNVSVVANYQYSDISRNYFNDSIDVPGFSKFSTDDYFGKGQFVEAYANIGLGNGFSLLQGADYRYSSMNNQFLSISDFGPYETEFKDTVQSQASLFLSLIYNSINQKLNIEVGGRLNVHSRYGNNGTYTFNPSYSFSKNFRVFGSIATAFKAPSLYQLYSSFGNLALKAETSTNYELGLQQQHGIFSNRLVYFHRIINDGLDFDNINYQYFNFNKQIVKGIEWESSVEPVKDLLIVFNYTYINPEENTQSRISFSDTSYDHLLKRPEHSFNINAGYRLIKNLYVSVSGKYVSNRFDVGGYQKADVELDSYFILNAYAEYQFKNYLKVFADAQNLTDKKFFDVRGYNSIPFLVNAGIVIDLSRTITKK